MRFSSGKPGGTRLATKRFNKNSVAWALYDWANSAFATTVMAGFFPLFFKSYWASSLEVTQSTFWLGLTNSASALALAIVAPFIGAVADFYRKKKLSLGITTTLGCLGSLGLFFVPQGGWALALIFYGLGAFGFMSSQIFYDGLLPAVAEKNRLHWVSALGYSLGYLGGGLLFLVNVVMTLKPELFGLSGKVEAVQWSFVSVAVWWALFSIPIFKTVPETSESRDSHFSVSTILNELKTTAKKIFANENLRFFLLAYILYIDGVNTTVKMAVDYGMSIGLEQTDLITALLLVQFIGFPAALIFGKAGEWIGAKKGIFLAIAVYVLVVIGAYYMTSTVHFYAMAVAIGLVQGGIQSLSRSYFSHIVPVSNEAESFGFYNMVGKFSAILGPIVVGATSALSGNPRVSILSLLIFFGLGAWLLSRAKEIKI